MKSFLQSKKLFRTIVVYLGSSWVLIEAATYFNNRFQYPDYYMDILLIMLIFGLFSFILIEWQSSNSERKRQSILPLGLHAVNFVVAIAVAYFYWNGAKIKHIQYQSNQEDKVSIAVMPFTNINPDSSSVWLGDAVCDQIIDQLTYIASIDVKSRSASFYFKDKDYNSVQIAGLLGVNKLLEGSVMLLDTMLRVSVKLMNPITGSQLWSQSFNRPISKIMDIQSEIAQTVANKINADISKEEEDKINTKLTNNIDAYEAYMKGKYHYNLVTITDNKRANEYFKKAIELDPDFAKAYAYLALTYNMFGGYWLGLVPDSAYQLVNELAEKSLNLQSDLALGHFLKSQYVFFYERNYNQGLKMATASFNLGDKEDQIWIYCLMLSMNKKATDAIELLDAYIKSNPTSAQAYQALCGASLIAYGKDMTKPLDIFYEPCNKCQELDPTITYGYYYLAELHSFRGEDEESLSYWNKLLQSSPAPHFIEGAFRSHIRLGDTTTAMQYYNQLEYISGQYTIPYVMARVYCSFEDVDRIMASLEEAYAIKDIEMVNLWFDPTFDRVRDEPRFQEMLLRLKYSDVDK